MDSGGNWWDAFPEPAPKKEVAKISPDALAKLLRANRSCVVIDVRKDDFNEAGYIKKAINMPAQSFHQTLTGSVALLSRTQKVVFTCKGGGRAARTAGWFAEALEQVGLRDGCEPLILEGGMMAMMKLENADDVVQKR